MSGGAIVTWLAVLVVVSAITSWTLVAGQSQEDSVGENPAPDARDAYVTELQQTVLKRDADIVHLKAEFATCDATSADLKRQLQSALLSDDVAGLLARYRATFGGEWQWNNDTRAIVAVKEK